MIQSSSRLEAPPRPAALRHLVLVCLPLAPLILVAIASAPGIYTPDSDDQLAQGMSRSLNDWHPPVMSILWGALFRLTGTPASLFWLQLGVIAAGVVAWATVFIRWEMPAGTFLLLLGMAVPSSIGFAGVLWKDVGMAFSLFTATGLIALAGTIEGRWRRVLNGCAASLLLYGLLVRSNSLLALLPLVLLLAWSTARLRPVLATCLSLVVIAGVYVGASKSLQTLFNVQNWYPVQYIMLYDLAALSRSTGDSRIPDSFKTEHFSLQRLAENYRDWTGNYFFLPYDGFPPPPLKFLYRSDPQDALRRAWLGGVVAHPREYLANRWRIFSALMSRPGLLDVFPAAGQATNAHAGSSLPGRGWAIDRVKAAIDAARAHARVYDGWFWLGALLTTLAGGLAGARKYPGGVVAAGLGASGLLYLAPYVFVAPATDFRYIYWCCIAGTVGSVIVASMLLAELRTRLASTRSL